MSVVGYARVSTDHQLLDAQRAALEAAGCQKVFVDQMSGVREDRPGLAGLLEYVRDGDTVVVVSLGRSLSGVIRTVETLTAEGVLLRSLCEGVDYSTPTGRMLAGISAALAAYERELMHERAAAARAAARARGRHTGHPPRLTPAQVRQVRALRQGGESIGELVAGFGVSRATTTGRWPTGTLSGRPARRHEPAASRPGSVLRPGWSRGQHAPPPPGKYTKFRLGSPKTAPAACSPGPWAAGSTCKSTCSRSARTAAGLPG